jgi:hypothetical protein
MSQFLSFGVLGAINMAKSGMGRGAPQVGWVIALGALVLGDLTLGCGQTSDVLTSRGGPTGTGAASNDVDGGVGAGAGAGGTGSNGGGASGSGARGGGTAGGVAGGGASVGGLAGSGAADGGAALDPLDPYAAERKQLADSLCSVLESYPCLTYEAQRSLLPGPSRMTTAEQVSICTHDLQVVGFTNWGNVCFSEWAQEMKCLIGLPRQCPCDARNNACYVGLPGSTPSPCPAEDQALAACSAQDPSQQTHDVSGPGGKCHWYKDGNGVCGAYCDGDPVHNASLGLQCDGSPDGAQACYCQLNGLALPDGVPTEFGHGVSFYADSCADAGQKLADGKCSSVLNCCFTWMTVAEAGKPSVQQCSCTSDPKRDGYDSCQAIATQGGGQVVDICPQYLTPMGGFPFP